MKNVDRALALPGLCLVEARRVFGEKAEVTYGGRWATAGLELEDRGPRTADEITVHADDALERLLACLKGLAAR